MTPDYVPSCDELAAEMSRIRAESINTCECNAPQTEELRKLASAPPNDLIVLKDGSRSLVAKHTLSDGTDCVLKYYHPKNLAKKINYGLRGSRAMRSWIAARAFEYVGIPSPTAMMIHEQRGAAGITLKQSMLASRLAPGIPLSDITHEAALREIAEQLEKAFATMAALYISHGDLKANNIIVDNKNHIYFIDLDSTNIMMPKKKWARLWNHDRARFLRNWPESGLARRILSTTIKPA